MDERFEPPAVHRPCAVAQSTKSQRNTRWSSTRLSTSLNALISLIAIIEMTHDSGSGSASQDALSLRLCLPGIRCFDRLKTLWRPEQHRRETKISSPLPLSTNESDQYYDSSDHKPLRHAVGPGFQVMSDLHLEGGTAESANSYEQFKIPPKALYLILAGDIGYFKHKDRYLAFLRRQCECFVRVFLIPGNHEFYGMSRRSRRAQSCYRYGNEPAWSAHGHGTGNNDGWISMTRPSCLPAPY